MLFALSWDNSDLIFSHNQPYGGVFIVAPFSKKSRFFAILSPPKTSL